LLAACNGGEGTHHVDVSCANGIVYLDRFGGAYDHSGVDDAALNVGIVFDGPRTLAPFDSKTIIDSVKKTNRLIVAHDAHKTCGVGAEIAAIVMEQAFDYLDAPVERVCGLDVPVPSGPLLTEVYPTEGDILDAIDRTLARGKA